MKIKLETKIVEDEYRIFCVDISKDSNFIAAACNDGKVKLFNAQTKKLIRTFVAGFCEIRSVRFSYDGKYVISVGSDGKGMIWLADNCSMKVGTFQGSTPFYSQYFDISSDNRYIASAVGASDCTLYEFTNKNNESNKALSVIKTFKGHGLHVNAISFTRDDKHIITGSDDRTLKSWCVETGKEIRTFTGHSAFVCCLSISLDNKYVVSGAGDSNAILWKLDTGERLKIYEGHNSSVSDVLISSDNGFVVTSSWDKSVKVWDLEKANVIHGLTGHKNSVLSISLSPDDSFLVTGSWDKTVRMLDLSSVPGLPGMGWKTVRPFVMLRWLEDRKRASLVVNDNNEKDDDCFAKKMFRALIMMDTDDILKYVSSLVVNDKVKKDDLAAKEMLLALIMMDTDDVFNYILSYICSMATTW